MAKADNERPISWERGLRRIYLMAHHFAPPGPADGAWEEVSLASKRQPRPPDFEMCWMARRGEGSIEEILDKFRSLSIEPEHVLDAIARGEITSEIQDIRRISVRPEHADLSLSKFRELFRNDQMLFVDVASAIDWYRKITAPSA